jgi:hypothetical protein
MKSVYLIHWNAAEAKQKVALLKKAGYDVTYEPLTPTIFREIRRKAPDAFVIDLSRLPSHGWRGTPKRSEASSSIFPTPSIHHGAESAAR